MNVDYNAIIAKAKLLGKGKTIIKPYKQAKLLLKRYVLIFDFCTVKFIENTEYK